MGNLARLLEDSASAFPDRTALVAGEWRLTYAEVDSAANQVANLLVSRGIQPGDKVALSCPNLLYFPIIYFGILKAGATVVPLNILLRAGEIAYHLTDSDAKAFFAFDGTPDQQVGDAARKGFAQTPTCTEFFPITTRRDAGEPSANFASLVASQPTTFPTVQTGDDDTAVILYTSGTTGRPKGAELRHRNMFDNALIGGELLQADLGRPDVHLCVLPLFHSFGQTAVLNCAFAYGGTIVMLARFEAKTALELMIRERVTCFAGVPTMYWSLLGALDDTTDVGTLSANLRLATAAGSALPGEVHRQFQAKFGVTILEGYGLSETSPIVSFGRYGDEPRVGSIGVPVPGVDMKLINDDWTDLDGGTDAIGEIAIRGHNVMKGYYKRPDATAEAIQDGWFRTGDLARKDADGYYFIVDRSKDLIIRGGFNVYPREIEEVFMTHPAVSLVAVVGIPHESHGQEVKAFVVKMAENSTTASDLIFWGKEHLAGYKYPRLIEFVDELPMTATGKILKRKLVAPNI